MGDLLESFGGANPLSALTDALFGNSGKTTGHTTVDATSSQLATGTQTGTKTGTESKGLEIDQAAVDKIVQDILSGESGLADIFSQEAGAGVYASTSAKQAAGDLVSKIAGEIAKLQAKEVTTYDVKEETEQEQKATSEQLTDTDTRSKTKGGILGFFSFFDIIICFLHPLIVFLS